MREGGVCPRELEQRHGLGPEPDRVVAVELAPDPEALGGLATFFEQAAPSLHVDGVFHLDRRRISRGRWSRGSRRRSPQAAQLLVALVDRLGFDSRCRRLPTVPGGGGREHERLEGGPRLTDALDSDLELALRIICSL